MKFYNITYDTEHLIKEFYLKIPENPMVGEDTTIKRVCVSTSLSGCFTAVPWQDDLEHLADNELPVRVYEFDIDFNEFKKRGAIYTPEFLYKNGLVDDALETQEHWILENIKPTKSYEIILHEYQSDIYAIIPFDKQNDSSYIYNNGISVNLLSYTVCKDTLIA